MSEALSPPPQQQDADIAAMAADLGKRRRRLQLLNLAILLVPLAAGAIFLVYGRNDREWVRKEVGQNVYSSVAETIGEAVPPAVKVEVEETVPRAVEKSVAEKVLPAVRATVEETVPPAVEKTLAEPAITRRLEALVAASAVSRGDLRQVEAEVAELKTRLVAGPAVPQDDLRQLKADVAELKGQLEGQERRIRGLERSRRDLADLVIGHLKEVEALLPADLDERWSNLPALRERLGDIGKVRDDLRRLRLELEKTNAE